MFAAAIPLLAGLALALPQVDRDFAASGGALNWRTGAATLDLFIDPDGTVRDCTALYADDPARSGRACQSLIGRMVQSAARGADGQPIHALYSVGFMTGRHMANFDQRHLPMPADLVVDVQSLPGGASQQGVMVVAEVAANGAVTDCQPMFGDDALSALACQQARGKTFRTYRDAAGIAVPYLTDLKVMFRVS